MRSAHLPTNLKRRDRHDPLTAPRRQPRPGRSGTHEHGSHSRRLSHHFIEQWKAARPQDVVTRRDLGVRPPSLLTVEWIRSRLYAVDAAPRRPAAGAGGERHPGGQVIQSDVLVLGVPLYSYSYPAAFKAWIDQIDCAWSAPSA